MTGSLPTYLPTNVLTYLFTHLLMYLPTYLPTYLPIYLPTYIPTYIRTYLCTYLPMYLPTYIRTFLCTFLKDTKIPNKFCFLLQFLILTSHIITQTCQSFNNFPILTYVIYYHLMCCACFDCSAWKVVLFCRIVQTFFHI